MMLNPRSLPCLAALAVLSAACGDTAPIDIRDLQVSLESRYTPANATIQGRVELPEGTERPKLKVLFGDGAVQELDVAKDGKFTLSHTYVEAGTWIASVEANTMTARGVETVEVNVADAVHEIDIKCQVCDDPMQPCRIEACATSEGVMNVNALASFRGEAKGGIGALRYRWDWGDDSTHGEGQVASHQYRDNGEYVVRLTVEDSFSSTQTLSRTINVSGLPTVQLTAETDATSGAAPLAASISLRATGKAPMTIFVNWKDGSTSTFGNYPVGGVQGEEVLAEHAFEAAGTYDVEATVLDAFGRTATQNLTFTVN